ncbi:MAG: cell filamentation protein Fic [Hyphomicrobium sp. 12-62-95]|nr:MAG: cell filamentation protein Fic [Hyphomicrobium sp. 12-62-95]
MRWNWQQDDWPNFRFDSEAIAPLEGRFLRQGGVVIGSVQHLAEEDRAVLTVEIISAEALKTSEIEGEILDRESLQSSIRRQFGLVTDHRRVSPAEQGIAELMVDLYRSYDARLSDAQLFRWHDLLTWGRRDIKDIGQYRTHPEPMQIVSGPVHAPKVHFEAPPSSQVPDQMAGPGGVRPMSALARAGIAHLYFESIHPFEDGNGRIGRAISEKALAQGLGQPSLTALSVMIEQRKKDYYKALEFAHRENEVTKWLMWFAATVLEAQQLTQRWIDFLIAKTKLFDSLRGKINARQEKALLRMMREGPDGFKGGLSAGKYTSITGAPPATARRDLAELVALGALTRTGERRGTRYWLMIISA